MRKICFTIFKTEYFLFFKAYRTSKVLTSFKIKKRCCNNKIPVKIYPRRLAKYPTTSIHPGPYISSNFTSKINFIGLSNIMICTIVQSNVLKI